MAKRSIERLADIWRSNVNEFLDRLEDPDKMVRQVIRDMEVAVDHAVAGASQAVAEERRLEKQHEQHQAEIARCRQKAERAVADGDEEYARLALARKADLEAQMAALAPALVESRETTQRLRQQLEDMRLRLQEARNRQQSLVSRYRAASRQVPENGDVPDDPFARFRAIEQRVADHESELSRFAARVEETDAEAEVHEELARSQKTARRLDEADRARQVEEELAALRQRTTTTE